MPNDAVDRCVVVRLSVEHRLPQRGFHTWACTDTWHILISILVSSTTYHHYTRATLAQNHLQTFRQIDDLRFGNFAQMRTHTYIHMSVNIFVGWCTSQHTLILSTLAQNDSERFGLSHTYVVSKASNAQSHIQP